MNTGKFIFSQLTDFVNKYEFNKCVKRYFGDYRYRDLNSWNHFLQLLFGQMTGLNSITGICLCLKAHKKNLYHLGIKQFVKVSSLSRAGENRDWRIFADFGNFLIQKVRPLYSDTTVTNINIDNEILEQSYNIDETCGLRSDKTVLLTIAKSKKLYPEKLRLVEFYDQENDELLVFLTNNFDVTALEIANLYKNRWQIEVFFKWIKQNLTIKKFWGHSQNAVCIQLWVAIIAYLLVAYLKHALKCDLSVYEIMQILGVSAFDRTPIRELLTDFKSNQNVKELQYSLFDNC